MRLTVNGVRGLRAPGKYLDGHGLLLNVVTAYKRYWLYRYQRDHRERVMSLGNADVVTLGEARRLHAEARAMLARGIDPLEARQASRAAQAAAAVVSFAQATEAYIAAHKAGWRGRSEEHWRTRLAAYAFPVFGAKAVADIDREDVLAALGPIWTAKNPTAAAVRNRVELVIDYAIARGWRSAENPARWRGGLKMLLAAGAKVHAVEHRAALSWREAPTLMATLASCSTMATKCLRFLVLTAVRSNEARGCRWSEIDPAQKLWVIPATRMKTRKEHRVPLSGPAMAILDDMRAISTGDLVFFGRGRRGGLLADKTLRETLQRVHPDMTVHGMRSTFRDWAADTGRSAEAAELALAHAVGNAVARAYARSDLLDQRRTLMSDWARFLIPSEATIVPLVRPAA